MYIDTSNWHDSMKAAFAEDWATIMRWLAGRCEEVGTANPELMARIRREADDTCEADFLSTSLEASVGFRGSTTHRRFASRSS